MNSALAKSALTLDDVEALPFVSAGGAQSILAPLRARPAYWPQGVAIALYAALLAAGALNRMSPAPAPAEDALELVMLPAPVAEEPPPPVEEPPPPVAEEPPPVEEPPPPVAEEPAVAPVEPKPKPKPPQAKPKVAEHKPVATPRPAAQSPAAPRPSAPPPPNAVPSGYFNQVESRVAHAAQNHPLRGPGRVGYRIVIAPSGSVISASISSSGHPDLDAAARRAVAGPFPSFGGSRPVAVSGGIRYQ
jgi:protein TonB